LVSLVISNGLPLLSVVLFAYAAFWAFNIRQAQIVRIYRNQALGMGLLALAWILFFIGAVSSSIFFPAAFGVQAAGFNLVMIVLFYWIDASVLAARRSDPLLRDSLDWSKVRRVLWGIIVGSAILATSLASYYEFTTNALPQFMSSANGALGILYLSVYFVVPAGIIMLPIAAYRSKDRYMRRNLEWFGAFVVVVEFVGSVGNASNSAILLFGGLCVAAYCLYRSAKSLVPLNRISLQEVMR
jgi:hypothetical protein